ncbi:hypothetical protein EO238_33870, partial [Citrobacter sp. AAK_AS5]
SEPPCGHAETPSSILSANEACGDTWSTLGRMAPEHREILLLKYIQELSYEEISALLGIPRGTVMSRLYHARKAFQKEYG